MSLTTERLTRVMEVAVQHSIEHVEAGRSSEYGVNEVARIRDPSAHAEIMAMRQMMRDQDLDDLAGHSLLATGEPCRLCYRFALDHKVEHIYVAVDAEQVADFGIDYRSSYPALGVDRAQLTGFTSLLPVPEGKTPFIRHLELQRTPLHHL